ncbi:MAG: METTL5 family protein [Candidatus Bathyarchaeia archaeon]
MGYSAQKRIIRKLDLERFLAEIKPHPRPSLRLEQYTTPTSVAATVLYLAAYVYGDIIGKVVLDLGCGTGRLALGCAFLGAKSVVGVDIDSLAVKLASEASAKLGFNSVAQWVNGDLNSISGKFDTVLQNPPFGVHKRGADRVFLERALQLAESVYSLHNHPFTDKGLLKQLKANSGILQIEAPSFITRIAEAYNARAEAAYALLLTIPHMFNFHSKEKREIITDLYVIKRSIA